MNADDDGDADAAFVCVGTHVRFFILSFMPREEKDKKGRFIQTEKTNIYDLNSLHKN